MKLLKKSYPPEDKTVHPVEFYLAFEGRPIYVSRGRASIFDINEAQTIQAQLQRLGYHTEIVDTADYPFKPTKLSKQGKK